MPRAQIGYHETANRVTFTYRPPAADIAPLAGLWSLLGGTAVGVGVTMALVIAGGVGVMDNWTGFRVALAISSLIGTILVYGMGYWLVAHRRVLQISFDYVKDSLVIRLPEHKRQVLRCPFQQAASFHLAERLIGRRAACALVMETTDPGSVVLVTVFRPCHHEPTQLPHLAGRLNAYLDAVREVPDNTEPVLIPDSEPEVLPEDTAEYRPPNRYALD